MKRLGEFILEYPKTVLFTIAIIAFSAIFPALQIKTDFNLEGFYPFEDQVIRDYQVLEDEFGRDDNSIVIGFKSDSLFTSSVLSDLANISDQLKKIEYIEEVYSVFSSQKIDNDQDQLVFSSYLEKNSLNFADLESIKSQLTTDPFANGFLVNRSGNATAIVLQIDEEVNTYSNRNFIIDSINEILTKYNSDYEFHISGIPYFRNQYVNMLNGEIIMYISISSILIIFLLWYLYRTIWGILFPMIIVWATLLITVALIQLTGGYLEIMSSTIAPILLCVGVADSIHMISKYDDSREHGINKRKSILEMLSTLGSATLLTSITTAIGFATLITSSVMPMQRFGAYTALGVMVAYLITIFFLPAALARSKNKRVFNEKSGSLYPILNSVLNKISAINRIHYHKIIISGVLLTLAFGYGIKNVEVNGRVFDDVGEDNQLMIDSRFFSDEISPQFPMEFIIDTGEPEKALTLNRLEKLERLEELLLTYPEFERVTGLHTLLKEVNGVMNNQDRPRHLPESDSAIAQYILLLEINEADELYQLIDFDYSKLRLTAFTDDVGSKRINEVRKEINPQVADIFDSDEVLITGTTILSADLTDKIVYSLAWSILLAILAITLIMAGLFRSFKLALIALIPNIIPLIIVAGVMGYLNVDIKPSTAVIFTIALGIAVDDSIHYLARFRIEYLRRKTLMPAVTATTIRTGRAIIITSIILIAGFGTLITSAFTSTAMMGVLVCTTIFSALIADLFILPSLFYWLKPNLIITKH